MKTDENMFSKICTNTLLLAILSLPPLSNAAQQPDGVIVPFSSQLPACASVCGKLFDVQGACSPPVIASVSSTCFCSDARLQPFTQSTAEVQSICGTTDPNSCTSTADLQKIQNWYNSLCNIAHTATTSASTAPATSTGSSTKPQSVQNANEGWFATHWRWVVMIIVMAVGLASIWMGAVLLRRRYIRKKEKEIEMRPPVAWGPHQMQAATRGYGVGVVDARGGAAAKEARSGSCYTS